MSSYHCDERALVSDEAIPQVIAMKQSQGYVYLMTNEIGNIIYTGVTSDLQKRVYEHKNKMAAGFTTKYNITKLVYFEAFDSIEEAIMREKQIKAGSRKKKLDLIKSANPSFMDLYSEL